MAYFPIILSLLFLIVILTRMLTVFLHELGHAIPAVFLTREKVAIYIGSYGSPEKCFNKNIGLLQIWITKNPLKWMSGICIPFAEEIEINRHIIITLTGPIISFIIAVTAAYLSFTYEMHEALQLFIIIFLGSSIFDLAANLIPQVSPYPMHDGRMVYNDGQQLKHLFASKRFARKWSMAISHYNAKQYEKASRLFNLMRAEGYSSQYLLRLALSANIQVKNFEKAKEVLEQFLSSEKMDSDDFANAGYLFDKLGVEARALEFYDRSLANNPRNVIALNNKGYMLIKAERYEEAMVLLQKAVLIDHKQAYAYNNLGLCKLKTGRPQQGLQDIRYSLMLDNGNAYAYRNLGIYHLDRYERTEALQLFRQAKQMDDTTDQIDVLIMQASRGH